MQPKSSALQLWGLVLVVLISIYGLLRITILEAMRSKKRLERSQKSATSDFIAISAAAAKAATPTASSRSPAELSETPLTPRTPLPPPPTDQEVAGRALLRTATRRSDGALDSRTAYIDWCETQKVNDLKDQNAVTAADSVDAAKPSLLDKLIQRRFQITEALVRWAEDHPSALCVMGYEGEKPSPELRRAQRAYFHLQVIRSEIKEQLELLEKVRKKSHFFLDSLL